MQSNDEPAARITASCFLRKFTAPAAGFWLLLFALGFPPATFDDLFFVGAPIELATKGDYNNPLLPPAEAFTGKAFYLHPPFYSHCLAGWLKVFGVHGWSLRAYQCACGLVASLCLAGICRRCGLATWAYWALVLALAALAGLMCLRHDMQGLAFFSAGALLLLEDRPWRWCCGLALLGLAVGSAPVLLAYGLALGAAAVVAHAQRRTGPLGTWALARLGALLMAVAAVFLLFLLAVRFDLGGFLHDFTAHARMRRPAMSEAWASYFHWVLKPWRNVTDLPVMLLFATVACLWLAGWRRRTFTERTAGLGLMAAVVLNVMLYAVTFQHITFICWVALAVWLGTRQVERFRPWLVAVAGVVFLLNHSLLLVRLAGQQPGDPAQYAAIRQYVATHPDRKYAIDAFAARYVFDYHFPAHARSWEFFVPLPRPTTPASISEKGDWVWIGSTYHIGLNTPDTGVTYGHVRIFGREFKSLPLRPAELVMLE